MSSKSKPKATAKAKGKPEKRPRVQHIATAINEQEQAWNLPPGCEQSRELERTVDRYGVFEFERQVYRMTEAKPRQYRRVSNFTCTIHQHILGETPTRLVCIENTDKQRHVVHVAHDCFNSLPQFTKMVTGWGNYQWKGDPADYQRYLFYMMDHMGSGRMILEPGMQPEGFFACCNAVLNGSVVELDPFGCFDVNGEQFYVPAANALPGAPVDEGGNSAFRRVNYLPGTISFLDWTKQMRKVYGDTTMVSITFTIATLFWDHIKARLEGFPLLFFYGPAGTGKDGEIKSCMRITGTPQPPIRLPGKNTGPALVNVFASVRGVPLYLTEYVDTLSEEMHEYLKGIWDGEGRQRGQLVKAGQSRYTTENVPIRTSCFLSGNKYPNVNAALLDRLIVVEKPKLPEITEAMRAELAVLNGMNDQGLGHILADVVRQRSQFVAKWHTDHLPRAQAILSEALPKAHALSERMQKNMAALVSVHLFFRDHVQFAYSTDELVRYLVAGMMKQDARRTTGDHASNFFTCFVAAVNQRRLVEGVHFKLSDNLLGVFWPHVFPAYMEQHRHIFGVPGDRDILSQLQGHPCFLHGPKKAVHEGYCIGDKKSTAYLFDVDLCGTDLAGLLAPGSASEEHAHAANGEQSEPLPF